VGGAGSPSNTMLLGPRPTSVPSGILIYETVWPQYTRVTDDRETTSHDSSRTLHCNGRLKIASHLDTFIAKIIFAYFCSQHFPRTDE